MKASSDVVTPGRQSVGCIQLKLLSLLMSSASPRVLNEESMKALESLSGAAMHLLLTSNRQPLSVEGRVDEGEATSPRVLEAESMKARGTVVTQSRQYVGYVQSMLDVVVDIEL